MTIQLLTSGMPTASGYANLSHAAGIVASHDTNDPGSSVYTRDKVNTRKHASSQLNILSNWRQQIEHADLKAEIAKDKPVNSIWINFVNQSTGEVVFRFPPEIIRLLSQYRQASGIIADFWA